MSTKVTIEVDVKHEAIVRRALALAGRNGAIGADGGDGTVFDVCEEAVIQKGRSFQRHVLSEAVARRIEAAEKKGAEPRV